MELIVNRKSWRYKMKLTEKEELEYGGEKWFDVENKEIKWKKLVDDCFGVFYGYAKNTSNDSELDDVIQTSFTAFHEVERMSLYTKLSEKEYKSLFTTLTDKKVKTNNAYCLSFKGSKQYKISTKMLESLEEFLINEESYHVSMDIFKETLNDVRKYIKVEEEEFLLKHFAYGRAYPIIGKTPRSTYNSKVSRMLARIRQRVLLEKEVR